MQRLSLSPPLRQAYRTVVGGGKGKTGHLGEEGKEEDGRVVVTPQHPNRHPLHPTLERRAILRMIVQQTKITSHVVKMEKLKFGTSTKLV